MGATRSATDAAREQWLGEQQCTFQSFAAVAADAPTDAPPRDTQPTASITLEHTESHCFVQACLYSKLAASATLDSLLITRPADVLFFNVQHVGTNLPSFHIEPRLYLDAFCWEQRHGARIDGSEQARRLAEDDARLAALQGKRASLHSPAGEQLRPLLRTAQAHFAGRDESYEHSAQAPRPNVRDWLAHLDDAVAERIRAVDSEIDALRARVDAARADATRARRADADDPALRAVGYELYAALFYCHSDTWAYVRHGTGWWRVADGFATAVDEADVLGDTRGADTGEGVFHLVYVRTRDAAAPRGGISSPLAEAIAADNGRAAAECGEQSVT